MSELAQKGCSVLLHSAAATKAGEKVLIITDDTSVHIAEEMYKCASAFTETSLVRMKPTGVHGAEPTAAIAAAMLESDVLFSATTFSLFNTSARIEACKNGARFVNMADYSMAMLEEGCLFADFDELCALTDKTAELIEGKKCVLTTPAGTHLTCEIEGRTPIKCYGIAREKGMASAPPIFEAAVGPLEGKAEGVIVADAAIPLPGIGVVTERIEATVEGGYITKVTGGEQAKILSDVFESFGDKSVYLIAEIGCGMNTGAKVCGRMLVDEAVYGTIHIGVGNNLSYGGSNAAPSHIDLVMYNPTFTVDDRVVYKDGELIG